MSVRALATLNEIQNFPYMGIMNVECCGSKSHQDQVSKSLKGGKRFQDSTQDKGIETMEVSITLVFR